MLTHISIENFKGIRERVDLELKPITLLFGPNNAGKSTILHALLYAQEVFERHNLNADRTATGGPFNDLGGFHRMVHGHDLTQPIKLGFQFNLDEDDFPPYEHDADAFETVLETKADQLIEKLTSAKISVTIRWPERAEPAGPIVESCVIELNSRDFAEITFDDTSRQRRLKLLALDHPVFRRPYGEPDDERNSAGQPPRGHFPYKKAGNRDRSEISHDDPLYCAESPLSEPASIFASAFDEVSSLLKGNVEDGLLLPSREQDDALPRADASVGFVQTLYGRSGRDALGRIRDRFLKSSIRTPHLSSVDIELSMQRMAFDIAGLLNKIVTNALQALRRRLRDFRYLGPVREIPSRISAAPETPDPSRWSTGLGAWDHLQSCDGKFVEEVSDWLSNPGRLNAGVRLNRRNLIPLDLAQKVLADLPSRRPSSKSLDNAAKQLAALPAERRVFLVPNDSEIELSLHDVGVGISQLIPVVVTALDESAKLAAIEEPEYHLHPRLQADVADLFVAAARIHGKQCLIELHSEHVILRLQRLIREGKLAPGELSVNVVRRIASATRIDALRLDQDGDFLDDWPGGFFPERLRELL